MSECERSESAVFRSLPDAAGAVGGADLLIVTMQRDGAAQIVSAAGEVDIVTAPQLRAVIGRCVADRPRALVIDLTGVGFFSGAGVTAVVEGQRHATPGTAVRVVARNSATLRPLRITGVADTVDLYRSVAQALAG